MFRIKVALICVSVIPLLASCKAPSVGKPVSSSKASTSASPIGSSPTSKPSPVATSAITSAPPSISSGQTYYQSDFQNTSLKLSSDGFNYSFIGWTIRSQPLVGDFYSNGDPGYVDEKIVLDPAGSGRKVLFAQSINDNPNYDGMTRAQTTIEFKPTTNLSVYHTSHRMFLPNDIGDLTQFPDKISAKGTSHWVTLYETWNIRNPDWDGDIAGSARWSFGLRKESGSNQPLTWEISAEYMQPQALIFKSIWPIQVNNSVEVPLGKWFTLDYYLKRGQGSDGQLVITIKVDGESPKEIFNIHNSTVYPDHPELNLKALQPFKLYSSDVVLDWLKDRGKMLAAYYNDFKWFVD